jgi:hypothetical protein
MKAWSILLGVLALVSTGLGVLTTPLPVIGAVFSFGAPALAIAGVITGGVAMSRAKREGKPTDAATAGVVVSGLAFIPALLTALTCGVCNALCSAGEVQTHRSFDYRIGVQAPDGGVGLPPPPPLAPLPDPPGGPSQPAPSEPAPAQPGAPPPAFPPPPLPN